MKLYTSLIYRELKLTRKRFLLMLILFLLLAALMLTPIIIGGQSVASEMGEDQLSIIILASATVALTGGVMAGTNNGLQKADINSGWKRYSFVLPITAKQQALSDLLTKLCHILLFGLLSSAFALVCKSVTGNTIAVEGFSPVCLMLNIYFGAICAVMLVDIAYSYIMMFANDKKQLKMISVIAFVGAGVVYRIFKLFPGMNKAEKPVEGGAMISDEALNRFLTGLCSGKTTLCILAVFGVLCVLFFLAMWRSHERREP
ncbi:MAG: ABC-2 transporter permease [Ruminococcus sp.]|uniref:ABC-2 transporter permease n=1 Tax=uncultured Ruminococcus sp. TaxID=165186 RepID=UPI001B5EECD4|nr:ABC-2 transporter permease [uncultured Ruminococcus sp.]MBP3796626.1 ABC-2 transporter permease [Ruminococcus sp.]